MKMVKSLILGSAAGLLAMGGAQAADLPVKAKAVEYVKICSLYGAGFYYIPGTDTCIKLGGYLRADSRAQRRQLDYTGSQIGSGAGQPSDATSTPAVRVRTSRSIPAPRPNTAWFVPSPRDFLVVRTRRTAALLPGSAGRRPRASGAGRRSTAPAASLAGALGCTTRSSSSLASRWVSAVSPFDAPWRYPGNTSTSRRRFQQVTGVNQFTYTAEFGNGVSA